MYEMLNPNCNKSINCDHIHVNETASLLVVDDNVEQLEILCLLLKSLGFTVVGCCSSTQALAMIKKGRFELLLYKIKMHELNGTSLLMQAETLDRDLVSVLMARRASAKSAINGLKASAIDSVIKPLNIDQIMPAIVAALKARELRIQKRELQEKHELQIKKLILVNIELDAFAGHIAHEISTPLQIMSGFANFLDESTNERITELEHEYLQRLIKAGIRADQLVKELLAFAKLGNQTLKRELVSLSDVFDEARSDVDPKCLGNNQEIEWSVQALPMIYADRSLMRQVFVNLLSNALKFSANKKVTRIELLARVIPEGHEIRIRDNGVGFDEAQAYRLFCPFQRLHRQDDFEGTGMGLVNVKRIIERHMGTITAHSGQTEGAEFVLILPTTLVFKAGTR